jgi:anti-sigma B factor antagonist
MLTMNQEDRDSNGRVLTLAGRLNAASTAEVKNRIHASVEEGRTHIVADLTGLDFIDSSGLASLVTGLKATREAGGFFRLVGAREQVLSVLKLTKLDRIFEIYPDEPAAWEY